MKSNFTMVMIERQFMIKCRTRKLSNKDSKIQVTKGYKDDFALRYISSMNSEHKAFTVEPDLRIDEASHIYVFFCTYELLLIKGEHGKVSGPVQGG